MFLFQADFVRVRSDERTTRIRHSFASERTDFVPYLFLFSVFDWLSVPDFAVAFVSFPAFPI